MSVWVCVPSARPVEQARAWFEKWASRGYLMALWRDEADNVPGANLHGKYPGYAVAVNELVRHALEVDPHAEWFVIGGDDVEPDPNHSAEEIARECNEYFGAAWKTGYVKEGVVLQFRRELETYGVMQPTGDRWGDSPASRQRFGENRGAYIDRVCGSAWIGREFAKRMYGGKGPLWPEYTHMYPDQELQEVALKMGVLWQRRDLTQFHNHWGRQGKISDMPKFLEKANAEMNKFKQVFEGRKQKGFPGHEPI